MKVFIDEKACWGCTLCTVTCEAVFKMNDSLDKAVVYAVPEEKDEELVMQAIDECPAHAIDTF